MTGMSPCDKVLKINAALVAVAIAGCAPREFSDGVPWEIQRSKTTNAAWQFVRGRPFLRFDAHLLDRLCCVETLQDMAEARTELQEIVDDACMRARYAFDNEIDRLPESSLRFLVQRYALSEHPTSLRESVRTRFWQDAARERRGLEESIADATDLSDLHGLARELARATRPSAKDRHGGGPLLALVFASIAEPSGPLDHGGPDVDVYEPVLASLAANSEPSTPTATDLLRRFAPIIVQERLADASYAPQCDQIGTVRLVGDKRRSGVLIDTLEPSVYGYVQNTWIDGSEYAQLTYTYWFPRHPSLKLFDAEAGAIEGATLRITLDQTHRPAVFETVLNCGCYHRAYVADFVESAACTAFGGPVEGKTFCVERPVEGKIDWIVPEIVSVGDVQRRPLLFSRAGYHGLAGISYNDNEIEDRNVLVRRAYALRPYQTLEHLSNGDGYGSMFGADGLVHGAGRLEGLLMAPTGMRSAGQPRQRGTQLLHWDQYDFDDPHLLERCLRLPPGF